MKAKDGVLAAVAVLAAAGITSWGQADEPTVQASWGAPTYGTPVEYYVGVLESWPTAGGDTTRFTWETPDTAQSFSYAYGYVLRCRVAGVDSMGRQGPWSLWSNEWEDNGPPGQPSVPLFELRMVDR